MDRIDEPYQSFYFLLTLNYETSIFSINLIVDGSSNFTPYAPIIEQVKLTNEELKQIIKMQQKNIDQELKLLQQISNPDIHRSSPTNDS